MTRMLPPTRPAVIALAVLAMAAAPRTASGQLRSFVGIKVLTVEPASGAEADAKAFARRLPDSKYIVSPRLVRDASEVPADDRGRFARCVVRNDLSEPRRFGLACSDYAGAYVGMLRAKSVKQLAERL